MESKSVESMVNFDTPPPSRPIQMLFFEFEFVFQINEFEFRGRRKNEFEFEFIVCEINEFELSLSFIKYNQ